MKQHHTLLSPITATTGACITAGTQQAEEPLPSALASAQEDGCNLKAGRAEKNRKG